MSSFLASALAYAERGWPVFPLKVRSKEPATAQGFKDASTDPDTIQAWWAATPDANIGIPTGAASGLFVVDLDDKDGRDGSQHWSDLAAMHGGDGAPLEHNTGSGGLHLVYRHVEGLRNSAGKLGVGIDTRGEGGYIVAAPSVHPSGGRYVWGTGALAQGLELPPGWLVERLLQARLPDAPPVRIEGSHTLTREDLEAFIAFKSRFPDAEAQVVVARAVLAGTSWGYGARHDRMVGFLGALRTFVLDKHGAALDPASSSVLFDACTAAATAEGVKDPTDRYLIADLIAELQNADELYRGKLEASRAAKKADIEVAAARLLDGLPDVASPGKQQLSPEAKNENEEAIQRAFGTDRTAPYSAEELAAMHPTKKRWLLVTPAGFFLRAPGGDYVPVVEKAILTKARDLLAPAYVASPPVLLRETDKGKLKLKSLQQVLDQYGQAPTYTSYSYQVPRSTLDGDTFTQRAGVARAFAPAYDAQVARWFELLAGPEHEAFLDWLATLTRTDRPTAGLCIMGTSGAGKDLLIDGLAEIWSGARLSFERALHRFNVPLTESPLVIANEEVRVPKEFSGSPSDALKEMISDSKRKVEAKYGGTVDLHGCLRVIMATNANGALKFSRDPTPSDIVALDDRILLLRPSEACRTYLEQELKGRETTEGWVSGQAIARHVTWLQQHRVVVPGPRFLVQGRGGMSDLLSADGRGSAVVLSALLEALLGPKERNPKIAQLWHGEVWASVSNLRQDWATYGRGDRPEDWDGATGALFERGGHPIGRGEQQVKMRRLKWPVVERAAQREGRLEELLELRAKETR